MARKLTATKQGAAVYARRKVIPEPVFGQIKEARGFRQFLLRGLVKVRGEWSLVALTHNINFTSNGLSVAPSEGLNAGLGAALPSLGLATSDPCRREGRTVRPTPSQTAGPAPRARDRIRRARRKAGEHPAATAGPAGSRGRAAGKSQIARRDRGPPSSAPCRRWRRRRRPPVAGQQQRQGASRSKRCRCRARNGAGDAPRASENAAHGPEGAGSRAAEKGSQ